MKPLRLIASPTRSRRLNEILGLMVLVAAGLLLLALASYTPSDPSFNTVGGNTGAAATLATGPAKNWTGIVGAYLSDALLQILGIAAFSFRCCWFASEFAGCARGRRDRLWPNSSAWACGLSSRRPGWR